MTEYKSEDHCDCNICEMVRMTTWVSVKDRFPTKKEQDDRILVWFNDGSELMGIQPKYSYIGPCDPYPYMGPSHWMPAPKPPQD